jgi:glycosidase
MKKYVLLLLLTSIWFAGCKKSEPEIAEPGFLYEATMPITLHETTQEVALANLVKDPALIDSVTSEDLSVSLWNDNKTLRISDDRKMPLGVIHIWHKKKHYDLVTLRNQKVSYAISYANSDAKKVEVAGDFNNWQPETNPFEKNEDVWQTYLTLAPGTYQYQLVVDGEWILDPENPEEVSNNIGGVNSLLRIEDPAHYAPHLTTTAYSENPIEIAVEKEAQRVVALWQNAELPIAYDDNTIQITIPQQAQNIKRSFIRVWASNEFGYSNDVLIPLEKGEIITSTASLSRHDKHAQVLYFMLVDRFFNGNPENDNPVDDPEIAPKANYMGGDIEGIYQKLEEGYFDSLGISMIWLSPITQNPEAGFVEYPAPHRKYSGYHGYWPITLTTIDHRLGNDAALHNLVQTAHEKEKNVILDYVSNHVHQNNKMIQKHPEWKTNLTLPDGSQNIRLWDEQRLTTWFDTFLPSLDFSRPEVIETMSDSALFWVEKFDIDGFRHDATKHIPLDYWQTLTHKLRSNSKSSLYQIGETFGSRELIGSYVAPDKLDGQFDFNLYFDLRTIMANDEGDFHDLANSLHQSLRYYGAHSLMGNITGNHDIPRFISFAGGALRFDDDAKEAGWNRDIEVEDTIGYRRLAMLTAFNMTVPGVPVIYYGDEIGMPGAGDPDNRRMMRFSDLSPQEKWVKEQTEKLVHLRRNNMSLMYGEYQLLHAEKDLLIFMRSYFNEKAVVIFNKSNQAQSIALPSVISNKEKWQTHFGHKLLEETERFYLELPPYTFEVLTK